MKSGIDILKNKISKVKIMDIQIHDNNYICMEDYIIYIIEKTNISV